MANISVIAVFLFLFAFFYIFNFFSTNYDYLSNYNEDLSSELFDFIVVGGGSAGAVVANRLSKNSRVLLIEAGGTPNILSHVPGLAASMLHQADHDWMYRIVPQTNACLLSKNNGTSWPRGKVLGGSSVLNYMQYVRGNPLDYEAWAKITNDKEWSYENVLKHFKASLNYKGDFSDNKKHYGEAPYGYMEVTSLSPQPLFQEYMDAGKELGFDTNIDVNGRQRTGFAGGDVTIANGWRVSTYTAFIKNFEHRKSFKISRYSTAIKIHLDKNQRAIGVWYVHHGKEKYARASKEIIISAGAVDSPKLLMLSGIGPKSHLKDIGIKPKVNLPVGENLQDHVAVMIGPFIINDTLSFLPERDFGLDAFINYFRTTGPLMRPAFVGQSFFGTSKVKETGIDWPNIQLYLMNNGMDSSAHQDFSDLFTLNADILKDYFDPVKGNDSLFMTPVLLRPKSTGTIKLKDKHFKTPPLIDPKYFSHSDDMAALLEATKMAMKILETKPFKKLQAHLSPVHFAPCKDHKFKSEAYFECYIRHFAMTLYHPAGTCAMGVGKDAVVDSKLRVMGVKGLRVADASIMPNIVTGNTNAPCIMIGEMAARMIREFWTQNNLVCDKIAYTLREDDKCYYKKLY